jgi:hypothetical protein
LGDCVYGVQFHIEATAAMIAEWMREDAACGADREAPEALDPEAHAHEAAVLCRRVTAGWLRAAGLLPQGQKIEREAVEPRGNP